MASLTVMDKKSFVKGASKTKFEERALIGPNLTKFLRIKLESWPLLDKALVKTHRGSGSKARKACLTFQGE